MIGKLELVNLKGKTNYKAKEQQRIIYFECTFNITCETTKTVVSVYPIDYYQKVFKDDETHEQELYFKERNFFLELLRYDKGGDPFLADQ